MKFHLCQINTTVGALTQNTDKIIEIVNKEKTSEFDVFIFPELTISGYPPLDLLDLKIFVNTQLKEIDRLQKATEGNPALIVLGYIEPNKGSGKNYFNSAIILNKGKIIYNYRKRLLPTYDVFDEARYFEPGKNTGLFFYKDKRIGIVICEDLWFENKLYTINPAEELFHANIDFLISINASPSIVGKFNEKIAMVKNISMKYGLPVIYINQVGGNDDIIFDGNSFIVNKRGLVVEVLPDFEECVKEITDDKLGYHIAGITIEIFIAKYTTKAKFFYNQSVYGIAEYMKKCKFKSAVIGESGGIDSAVVTAITAAAIGGENVHGATMPSEYSSEGSYKDSELLCENCGVHFYTFSIGEIFTLFLNSFNGIFPEAKAGLMEENLQARIRGMLLMSFSNRYGSLVLSTGNKSELSVGYCTVGGDMMGGLAPISDLYKMEVYALADFVNQFNGKEIIPQVIIDKAPSAELSPDQKDSDSLPSYPILDAILKYILEEEENDILEKIQSEQINKVLLLLKRAEFKRRQAAITIKMHKKAFGYGRRIPVAQDYIYTI